jgi:hypothetical protein
MTKEQYSPLTRAVSDAADKVYWDWGNLCPASADTIAAATLRAAAEVLQSDPTQNSQLGALLACQDQLYAIAKELERFTAPPTVLQ